MQNDILASLTRLSDTDLVTRLKCLLARERDVTAQVIAHLAELETRDVFLREGYSSLFVYCRDALGLSEWEAYNRIEVARAARRFPLILDMLASGAVHLTAVRLLAPHLTPANHRDVLESARGKRKPEVEEIVARLSPRSDVPTSIRRVSTPRPEPPPPAAPLPAHAEPAQDGLAIALPSAPLPAPPAAVMPLSPDRYKLQITIGGDTLEKLRLAKDMLGHAIPSGDDAAILDRALTALLVDLTKKKFADTRNPRPSRGTKAAARDPSAQVKRAVWLRDLGCCAYVGPGDAQRPREMSGDGFTPAPRKTGHRCSERRFVEFHHVDPHALGGEATLDQIELRCRRHNDYEGRLYFGKRRRARELVLEQVDLSVKHSTL